MRIKPCLGAATLILASVTAVPAQSASDPVPRFGTRDATRYRVGGLEFVPESSSQPWAVGGAAANYVGLSNPSTPSLFWAHTHLPPGALLQTVGLQYCRTASGDLFLILKDCNEWGGDCQNLQILTTPAGNGCADVTADLAAKAYTVTNSRTLLFQAQLGGPNGLQLAGAFLDYKLQMSPAPSTATFTDVPVGHPFFRAIEALAASGLTSGCGGGQFCPNQPVTRAEMAKFLANALGLHWTN